MYIRLIIIYLFLLFYCDIFPNMHILPKQFDLIQKIYILNRN